jgi:hypothetical protein
LVNINTWTNSNKGIATKGADTIPIKYEGDSGWAIVSKAITGRASDEAKSWRTELKSYMKGITCD